MIPDQSQAQLTQYIEQQQLLLNVTRQIAASPGLNETLPHILGGVFRALRADGVRLLVTGPGGQWRAYAAGPAASAMAELDRHIVDRVTRHGAVEIVHGSTSPEAVDGSFLPEHLAAVIAAPLIAHQTQHGVLWLAFQSPHMFGDAERTFLSILAGQAAIAIANARSFEAARRRREWLAAILASTPDPVLVVDRELCLQLVNPAAQDMFGITPEAVIGQALDRVVMVPELLALFHEGEPGEATPVMEYAAENGRTYSPSISDVRTEGGEMTGWVLVLRDISHFKRLNDNMSEFLSTVSHDMRSPLTFMKGYVDMLGMIGPLNERQSEFAEKIAGGVDQMADMVEKILEAGKLDPMTGSYELAREPCDLVEVVQKVMAGLVEPAQKKGLDFSATVAEGIPILNVDRAMLTSAFTNLVENAVKYTPDGGRVQVDLQMDGAGLVFRVTDNGYGISAEDQEKLFKRNARVRRKEWKRVKGSGLGLFIVKNVAQRHGGDAWVESVEGQGSTFFLSIPLTDINLPGGAQA
ncbi:MAG: PAS domain-containing protein, partial [Anaerolineae bacterium]|nr:PAS domain-containing protein [Anaerolineae bacterium]